jgi:hypothetical protein
MLIKLFKPLGHLVWLDIPDRATPTGVLLTCVFSPLFQIKMTPSTMILLFLSLYLVKQATSLPMKQETSLWTSLSAVNVTYHGSEKRQIKNGTLFERVSMHLENESEKIKQDGVFGSVAYVNTNLEADEGNGETCILALSDKTIESSLLARYEMMRQVENHFQEIVENGEWDNELQRYSIPQNTEELLDKHEKDGVITKRYRRIEKVDYYIHQQKGGNSSRVIPKMLKVMWKSYLYFSALRDSDTWGHLKAVMHEAKHHYNPLRQASVTNLAGYLIAIAHTGNTQVEIPSSRLLRCYEPKEGYDWKSVVNGALEDYVEEYEMRSFVRDVRGEPFTVSMRRTRLRKAYSE